ncbi:MAG: MotA/TolQ/ExbB proton channel family protein [Deltaproteobacteria bacterium]|nr:MotA/TolQ/ExbB proton channel family protein [Deltaproteobacteria bacterium]
MIDAIKEHPIIMLAVFSLVVVVMISIERFFTLYIAYRLRVGPFKKALEAALVEMDLNKALRIVSISPNHPVCKVARAGLMKANAGDKDLVRAMEVAQLEAMPRLQGLTAFLGMLGNLGTLIGLIGTVFGMIEAFAGLGVSDSGAKQEILARGISVAMNATAMGLIVAIPGSFFATLFGHRQERLIDQMEEVSLTIASHISQAARDAKQRAQTSR